MPPLPTVPVDVEPVVSPAPPEVVVALAVPLGPNRSGGDELAQFNAKKPRHAAKKPTTVRIRRKPLFSPLLKCI
jgi:hypothetical protein